ncbi:Lrp/AsnC family transcriptional regulator [Candidatus Woesearchaeota archaeon]|nr:Lrp/AsnC family transcriptional regulator [Candidatus Woesearchaeota archaeon]
MIDKKDQTILELLKQDASLSTYKIAKRTLIPQTTVLNRIKKLRKEVVIERYTVDIDLRKIGRSTKALIFVKVDKNLAKKTYGKVGEIENRFIKHHLVLNIKRLMGKSDFVIEVACKDVAELDNFLIKDVRPIEAIADTETVVILNEWTK